MRILVALTLLVALAGCEHEPQPGDVYDDLLRRDNDEFIRCKVVELRPAYEEISLLCYDRIADIRRVKLDEFARQYRRVVP